MAKANFNKVGYHLSLCEELNTIYEKKNHDYGDSFHDTFAEEGFAMARIRLSDKLNRFKTLSKSDKQLVTDESIRDTLMDLANYAIMTVLEMELAERTGNEIRTPNAQAEHLSVDNCCGGLGGGGTIKCRNVNGVLVKDD